MIDKTLRKLHKDDTGIDDLLVGFIVLASIFRYGVFRGSRTNKRFHNERTLGREISSNTVDGYVFRDDTKATGKTMDLQMVLFRLLFSGNAGIGKTTLAKILPIAT